MPRHFKMRDILSDEHYPEACALAVHRSTTVDRLWAWTRQHGYKISRGAVHNFMQSVKAEAADPAAELRSALLARIATLTPDQLAAAMAAVNAL